MTRLAIALIAVFVASACTANRPRATSPALPEPASQAASAPAPIWQRIGLSRQGRAIEAITLGHGPLRVYLIGGIHGDEQEGQAALSRVEELLSQGTPAARATTRLLRDANPDGTASRTRGNAEGRDLNRNWPAANFSARGGNGPRPLSEPETAAIDHDLNAFAPHLVIVFHSTPRGPFVNYDGPGQSYAEAFVNAVKQADSRWRVVREMGYATPGSLGSYVGVDRGVPILTIEFKRGQATDSVTAATLTGISATLSTAR